MRHTNEEMFHRNCILDLDSSSLLVNFLVFFFFYLHNVPMCLQAECTKNDDCSADKFCSKLSYQCQQCLDGFGCFNDDQCCGKKVCKFGQCADEPGKEMLNQYSAAHTCRKGDQNMDVNPAQCTFKTRRTVFLTEEHMFLSGHHLCVISVYGQLIVFLRVEK